MSGEQCTRFSRMLFLSYKGCLLGGLLGDVYGKPFETNPKFTKFDVQRYFKDEMSRPQGRPVRHYSDDTVMTIDIIKSLLEYSNFQADSMARRFAYSCFTTKIERYYGGAVTQVFEKWVLNDFQDVWTPAQEQFRGEGSFGNGAAMRVSPIGLICTDGVEKVKLEYLVEMAAKTSLLTHTHPLAVGGAVFQAISIRNVIKCSIELQPKDLQQKQEIQVNHILDMIETDLKRILELGNIKVDLQVQPSKKVTIQVGSAIAPYLEKLEVIRELLEQSDVSQEEIVEKLGNGIAALESVPTALYCFLSVLKGKVENSTKNIGVFEKTLQFAIGLKGDTDTIASMAGSLAGAFLTVEGIPENMRTNAEGVNDILNLAEKLFNVYNANSDKTEVDIQVEPSSKI